MGRMGRMGRPKLARHHLPISPILPIQYPAHPETVSSLPRISLQVL